MLLLLFGLMVGAICFLKEVYIHGVIDGKALPGA